MIIMITSSIIIMITVMIILILKVYVYTCVCTELLGTRCPRRSPNPSNPQRPRFDSGCAAAPLVMYACVLACIIGIFRGPLLGAPS